MSITSGEKIRFFYNKLMICGKTYAFWSKIRAISAVQSCPNNIDLMVIVNAICLFLKGTFFLVCQNL